MAIKKSRQISVGNDILYGIADNVNIPTFVINGIGLSKEMYEEQLDYVGLLQSVAPVFRVVVMTELDIFSVAKKYGWPIEHFAAPETIVDERTIRCRPEYLRRRVELMSIRYSNTHIVPFVDGNNSFASLIARKIGRPDLMKLVQPSLGSVGEFAFGDINLAIDTLMSRSKATFEGVGGGVQLERKGRHEGNVLIQGIGNVQWNANRYRENMPESVGVVYAEFEEGTSLAFESFIYSKISRGLGHACSVILPLRQQATLSADVFEAADLVVRKEGRDLIVTEQYGEVYFDLKGNMSLDWETAKVYSNIRRVSRRISNLRGAL